MDHLANKATPKDFKRSENEDVDDDDDDDDDDRKRPQLHSKLKYSPTHSIVCEYKRT